MQLPPWRSLENMPYAFGGPVGSGVIRATADDFQVDEILGFEPDGEGEHILLQVRKRDTNTIWLANQLAKRVGVPNRDVSYAGLKDRHAVTRQWFSIRLAGKPEPDWEALETDTLQVLRVERHRRKLRTGALRGNRFALRVRELHADRAGLANLLRQVRQSGMPNYFGEQRFGHDYGNLAQAQALFDGRLRKIDRKLRGLLISAARSQLFNEVLAMRIDEKSWDQPRAGDYMNLAGSRSGFPIETLDEVIQNRCKEKDIHPSGPLWGRGSPLVSGETMQMEASILKPFSEWCNGLEFVGLKQERRPLRIGMHDLSWSFPSDDSLLLEFSLPAGSYATVLLRELLTLGRPDVTEMGE